MRFHLAAKSITSTLNIIDAGIKLVFAGCSRHPAAPKTHTTKILGLRPRSFGPGAMSIRIAFFDSDASAWPVDIFDDAER